MRWFADGYLVASGQGSSVSPAQSLAAVPEPERRDLKSRSEQIRLTSLLEMPVLSVSQ